MKILTKQEAIRRLKVSILSIHQEAECDPMATSMNEDALDGCRREGLECIANSLEALLEFLEKK